jgi:hypothetical protein
MIETLTRSNADEADYRSTRLPLAGVPDFQRRGVVREREMGPRRWNKKRRKIDLHEQQ